jgi:hypothetical protein
MTKRTVKTVKQIIEEQREGNRCIVCHKKFQRKTQQKRLTCDEPYHGNLIVLKKERFWNDSVTLTLWDGESYHDTNKPFCGKGCAYVYAQFIIKTKGIDNITTVRLIHVHSSIYEVTPK